VSFAFVIAQGEKFARMTEVEGHGILEYSCAYPREVLEHCVGGNVHKPNSILLPLRAESEKLTR